MRDRFERDRAQGPRFHEERMAKTSLINAPPLANPIHHYRTTARLSIASATLTTMEEKLVRLILSDMKADLIQIFCHEPVPVGTDVSFEILAPEKLVIHGKVRQPLEFTLDSLARYPMVTRTAFVECAGNSAPLFSNEPMQITCGAIHAEVTTEAGIGRRGAQRIDVQPVGGGQSAEPVAQLVETRVGCASGGARGRSHAEGTLE